MRAHSLICTACAFSWIAFPWITAGQSSLIPVSDRRDHGFDPVNGILYIATTSGTVERYDAAAGALLTPFSVAGTSFNGIDVSRDGASVIVADASQGVNSGVFRVFDAATGNRRNAFYTRAFGEGEAWDVAVTNAGYALVTTEYNGSGWIPMRRLDLTTLEFSGEIRSVRQRTNMFRSDDGGTVLYLESNISSGPFGLYDAINGQFIADSRTNSFNSQRAAGVNRDGSLVAIEADGVTILDRSLNTVEILPGFDGGIGFSPVADILFVGLAATDEIVAIDTATFNEIERYSLSDDLPSAEPLSGGVMSFSGDGRTLYVSTAGGVSALEVTAGCYPDCTGEGLLDIFDFLCFQDAFTTMDPYANCDGNSVFDIFDFLCFQDAFVAGCP